MCLACEETLLSESCKWLKRHGAILEIGDILTRLFAYYCVVGPAERCLRSVMIALTYFVLRPKRGGSLDRTEYVLAISRCVFLLLGRPCQRKLRNGLRGTGPFLRLETLWGA